MPPKSNRSLPTLTHSFTISGSSDQVPKLGAKGERMQQDDIELRVRRLEEQIEAATLDISELDCGVEGLKQVISDFLTDVTNVQGELLKVRCLIAKVDVNHKTNTMILLLNFLGAQKKGIQKAASDCIDYIQRQHVSAQARIDYSADPQSIVDEIDDKIKSYMKEKGFGEALMRE